MGVAAETTPTEGRHRVLRSEETDRGRGASGPGQARRAPQQFTGHPSPRTKRYDRRVDGAPVDEIALIVVQSVDIRPAAVERRASAPLDHTGR